MKKKLINGMKNAKLEKLKRMMTLSALLFVMGMGMAFAADGYPPEANEPEQSSARITGTVVDQAGEPVAGANVVVKGRAGVGTVTDQEGRFTLQVAAGADLEISFLGYRTQTVKAVNNLTVTLAEDAQALDEVVVTAMGITRDAKALGYAMSTVSAKELTKVGTPNFATALYGKAAGVRINAAPGGQTSAVSMTVRGIGSISGNTQPLLVVDGVPVRNGNANVSADDEPSRPSRSWRGTKIEANGLVDINPEDVESISILKGAAASALYGSEAANGVIIVTSKKGATQTGVKVDFSATAAASYVAYMPKMQTEYGPGTLRTSQGEYELANDGFIQRSWNNYGQSASQSYLSVFQGTGSSNAYFGPKYDASKQVLYWDGQMRPYQAVSDNPLTDIYRTGYNQTYNVAVSSGSEKMNTRFSYTFVNDLPNQYNSDNRKHNFSLVGNINIHKKLRVDYTANYIRHNIHNRTSTGEWMWNTYNLTGAFDDIKLMREKYARTSLGYLNVIYNAANPTSNTLTPNEAFIYDIPADEVRKYMIWPILANNSYELNQRLIASVAPVWDIIDGLKLRGRVSTDVTATSIENNEATRTPISISPTDPGGAYALINKNYEIYYGDIMLMLNKDLTPEVNLTANAGFQGRLETSRATRLQTRSGLSVDNWFNLAASLGTNPEFGMEHMDYLTTAYFATVGASYNHWVYLEATGRQEKTSTLLPPNNSFFYPSVNASYIFSEHLKDVLPAWYNYGKLRASYGVVGNTPGAYRANVVYDKKDNAGYHYVTIPSSYGNESLKPETKYEFEVGLESRFFNNRLGFEVSYYNNKVVDQLLQYDVAASTGISKYWRNIGELKNTGVELTLNVVPVETRDWRWDLRFNYAANRNEITSLPDDLPYLKNGGGLGNTGSGMEIRSYTGRPMGDVYLWRRKEVDGMKVLSKDGAAYVMATGDENYSYAGNLLPTGVGGVASSLSYKNFTFDFMFDFSIGGLVLDQWQTYGTKLGITQKSLQYRDEAHGGVAYHFDGNGHSLANVVAGVAPAGGITYYDGVLLTGVIADDNGTIVDKNGSRYSKAEKVVPSSNYYDAMYNSWGGGGDYVDDLYDNSYMKCRELSLSYLLPRQLTRKFGCNNMSVSLFGRNLFYVFKNLENFDAEAASISTRWLSSGDLGATTAATRSVGLSIRASF
ncbi:MAG: SusC/RagA family TonB-linked outer membrane protein [Tannerella sp.]|jgi:TonB-linked SusC/RagA family outer membrane protein|nr:SusC/RagA family TonB-linked outer membrane protein [Tannerella sp.]